MDTIAKPKAHILNWASEEQSSIYNRAYERAHLRIQKTAPESVLIAEACPVTYLGYLFAALESGSPTFLGNPTWGEDAWRQMFEMVQPSLTLGDDMPNISLEGVVARKMGDYRGYLMIATGGTGGRVRFAMHTLDGLKRAARAMSQFFQTPRLNAINVLPVWHVSGLMPVVRAMATGGWIFQGSMDDVSSWSTLDIHTACISLVPTQLARAFEQTDVLDALKQAFAVIVGGAAARPGMVERARGQGVPVITTYGMTETGAMVTLQPIHEAKIAGCGRVLPHAFISALDEEGQVLHSGQVGRLQIKSSSLFHGYFPDVPQPRDVYMTKDLGYYDISGEWFIEGRQDSIINTGGEKVAPWELERILLATGKVVDCWVVGQEDPDWGERIVAVCVLKGEASREGLKKQIKKQCPRYMIPKSWLFVQNIPVNDRGKRDASALSSHLI